MDIISTFRKTSPGRQMAIAGLALVVILAALICLYFFVLRKPYGVLFSNLKPADAATIVQQLDKQKTPYRLADGGATVLVPTTAIDATRLSLMSGDLPLKGTVGFELFNKSDMGLTEFAQKINYQRALQGELERTIMTLDGVDSARVNLSLPEPSLFQAQPSPPKASVTLFMRAGRQISPASVAGIQRLVSAATPDLTVENTVVLDERGQIVSGGALQAQGSPPATPLAATPQLQAKQAVEDFYAAKVRQAIAEVYPAEPVTVSVELPAGLADAASSHAEAALQDWAPATRQFPVAVFVGTERPEILDNVKRLAAGAVNFNAELGDTLASTVQSAAAARIGSAQGQAGSKVGPVGAHKAGNLLTWGIGFGLGLVLLVVGLAVIARRPRSFPRPLTEQEREDYIRRLRAVLQRGEADAASLS